MHTHVALFFHFVGACEILLMQWCIHMWLCSFSSWEHVKYCWCSEGDLLMTACWCNWAKVHRVRLKLQHELWDIGCTWAARIYSVTHWQKCRIAIHACLLRQSLTTFSHVMGATWNLDVTQQGEASWRALWHHAIYNAHICSVQMSHVQL